MNCIYYCIYRYFLKSPSEKQANQWPDLVLAWTLWIHGVMAFWVFELATEIRIPISPTQGKGVVISVLILLMVIFYWHYSWKGNGARVIRAFEKRGDSASYARFGAFIWYESLLVVFIVAGALILCQKLTGWPPPP